MPSPKRAIYAGSFDPITNGHLWVIEKSAQLFDDLIVAIGENPGKNYWFSTEERLEMLKESVSSYKNLSVVLIGNKFLATYAQEQGITHLIRGIRSHQDYEYERSMGQINKDLAPDVETVYLLPPSSVADVSSSLVRSLVGPEGWKNKIKKYVPPNVIQHLERRNGSLADSNS